MNTPSGYYLYTNDLLFKQIKLMCLNSINLTQTMSLYENEFFKAIEYNKIRITFNLTGISSNIIGSCLYLNKYIYYGQFNCIDNQKIHIMF